MRRFLAAILGGFFGLLMGAGAGLYLSQTGALDMTSKTSLVAPVLGLAIGLWAGLFGGRRRRGEGS